MHRVKSLGNGARCMAVRCAKQTLHSQFMPPGEQDIFLSCPDVTPPCSSPTAQTSCSGSRLPLYTETRTVWSRFTPSCAQCSSLPSCFAHRAFPCCFKVKEGEGERQRQRDRGKHYFVWLHTHEHPHHFLPSFSLLCLSVSLSLPSLLVLCAIQAKRCWRQNPPPGRGALPLTGRG